MRSGPSATGVSVIHEVDRAFRCELWDPSVGPGADASAGVEDGSVIDLLVVHTPAARAGFGGTPQIEAFVDLAVADLSNLPFPYSHGYVSQAAFEPGAPPESRFATIMAYNAQCGDAGFFCPWTSTFSNPDMTCNGYPMGVPGDEPSSAVDGPADARRSLNELRMTVANFRVREPGPDLVVQSPAASDPTLEPNQAFTFSAAVRNIGDLPAATTVVTYYRLPESGGSKHAGDPDVHGGSVHRSSHCGWYDTARGSPLS